MSLLRDREQSTSANFTPATTTSPYEIDQLGSLTATATPMGQPHNEAITIIPGFEIPLDEADSVLRNYVADMLPQFPFVPLPTSNANSLYKDKPLLLKTIMWICRPPDADTSAAFERWFRQHIAHRIVVSGEKSLEILQAILVLLAWYVCRITRCCLLLTGLVNVQERCSFLRLRQRYEPPSIGNRNGRRFGFDKVP